jgi:transglutaminase-like putative cysteine protease
MEKKKITAPSNLVWATRALSLIGAASLALTGELQSYTYAIYGLLFILGLRIERQEKLVRVASFAQPFFALAVFALAIVDFLYLSGSFLLAVAHFLLLIQSLRLLALVTVRDNIGSVMLSSLMVLSASTLSVDWTFFLVLLLFLPTVVWTVVWANLFAEYQQVGFTETFHMRSSAWLRVVPAAKKATALAFLAASLTCAFVFITFPRLNLQGWRGQFLQPVRKTGFTANVDLRGGGLIQQDDTIVMRVEMDVNDRDKWKGFLRGAALDLFNGSTWRKSVLTTDRLFHGFQTGIALPLPRRGRGTVLRQSIYLESIDTTLLFAAPWAMWIGIDQPFVERGPDMSLSRRSGNTWRLHYTVDSFLPPSGALYQRFRPSQISPTLLEVKGVTPSRLDALLRQMVGTEASPVTVAKKIETALRNNYGYTLDLGPRMQGNPIEVFLFDRKKGHCEYFAAAMCLLLRQKGIPSRMVTGFVAHEWNSRGGYYIVRMKDAHAWVEAYIPSEGWMQFDPTPRDFNAGSLRSDWTRRWIEALDMINLLWNRQILSYNFERQISIVRSMTDRSQIISSRFENMGQSLRRLFNWKKGASVERSGGSVAGRGLLMAVLGLMAVVSVAGLLWRSRRRKQKPPVWFYPPLLKELEKVGGRKPPAATINEFVAGLENKLGWAAPAAFFLTDEYHRQRFGGQTARPDDKKHEIRAALAQLKRR